MLIQVSKRVALGFLVATAILMWSDVSPGSAPTLPGSIDAQVESAAVPAVHTLSSQFKRIVVVRMKNQTDMLQGLREAVEREKIRNAVILSGAGSLVSYHFHVVSNTTLPATEAFRKGEGAFDLISTTGYIIDGRVHCHFTFADTDKAMGGHLEPGTRVFTFAIITLGVLEEDASLKRFDDQKWR